MKRVIGSDMVSVKENSDAGVRWAKNPLRKQEQIVRQEADRQQGCLAIIGLGSNPEASKSKPASSGVDLGEDGS